MNSIIQDVHFYPYELCAKSKLSSRASRKTRNGALLRLQYQDGCTGFADCHPWPELGDFTLERQLQLLAHRKITSLTRKSLYFARLDALARKEKKTVFDPSLVVPNSHLLVTDISQWNVKHLEAAQQQKFSFIKFKIGRDLEHEIPLVQSLLQKCASIEISLRLDFNGVLNQSSFEYFLTSVNRWQDRIDFIEDPFPFHANSWAQIQQKYRCALACDHQSEQAIGMPLSAKVLVVKPAVQDETRFLFQTNQQRVIFTSYLDHPLGQLAAAYVAAKSEVNEVGGFLSHLAYETDLFIDQMHAQGPQLIPPPGTGLGFDSFLDDLNWVELKKT